MGGSIKTDALFDPAGAVRVIVTFHQLPDFTALSEVACPAPHVPRTTAPVFVLRTQPNSVPLESSVWIDPPGKTVALVVART